MRATIQEKRLQGMIQPNDPRLDRYAAVAASKIEQLCARWHIGLEVGQDLVKLALFDIVLYIGKLYHYHLDTTTDCSR